MSVPFKKGEELSRSLAYHAGRLLELFQWDESNLDEKKFKKALASCKEDLRALEELHG